LARGRVPRVSGRPLTRRLLPADHFAGQHGGVDRGLCDAEIRINCQDSKCIKIVLCAWFFVLSALYFALCFELHLSSTKHQVQRTKNKVQSTKYQEPTQSVYQAAAAQYLRFVAHPRCTSRICSDTSRRLRTRPWR